MERKEGEEEGWWRRFKRDFGSDNPLLEEKPSPLLWRVDYPSFFSYVFTAQLIDRVPKVFYLSKVSFDENVGRAFSAKAKSIIDEVSISQQE